MSSKSPVSFMMPSVVSLVIDEIRARLERLILEGRDGRAEAAEADLNRRWQIECAALVNELSGGSKAHWLSRAFSQAFLIRTDSDRPPVDVSMADIVDRIIRVLEQARSSLEMLDAGGGTDARAPAGTVRRFDFVHDATLRPVLEASYLESRRALDERRFEAAFLTSCGILEAVITDALQATARSTLLEYGSPTDTSVADWPFELRLNIAERAGIINRGCARLPPSARRYREPPSGNNGSSPEHHGAQIVSEREARVVGQVLNVVLRDLDPGR
jgi:hypothetical protein